MVSNAALVYRKIHERLLNTVSALDPTRQELFWILSKIALLPATCTTSCTRFIGEPKETLMGMRRAALRTLEGKWESMIDVLESAHIKETIKIRFKMIIGNLNNTMKGWAALWVSEDHISSLLIEARRSLWSIIYPEGTGPPKPPPYRTPPPIHLISAPLKGKFDLLLYLHTNVLNEIKNQTITSPICVQ